MTKVIAQELAKKQKEISVAEFFERNKHILGFGNQTRALLTSVKEGVDNSLDACEEAKILPELIIQIIDMAPKPLVQKEVPEQQSTLVSEEVPENKIPAKEDRYRIVIEDNGPGIIKKQIPNIFGKLLSLSQDK